MAFLAEIKNKNTKITIQPHEILNWQNDFEKIKTKEKLTLSYFKIYCNSIIIQLMWYWHKIDI
jgi:hypothetical protein